MKPLLLILIFVPGCCQADWKNTLADTFIFATGIAVGFFVHEAGHWVTAKAYGEKLSWDGGKFECEYPCKHIDNVAVAGNLATAIVGESILHIPHKYGKTAFADGIQVFTSLNPINYYRKDISAKGGYGDYKHVNDSLEAALAIHGASVGYRQFSGRWAVTPTARGIQFSARF